MTIGESILLGLGAIIGLLTMLGVVGVPLTTATAGAMTLLVLGSGLAMWRRHVARAAPNPSPWRGRLTAAEGVLLTALVVVVGVAAWRASFYPVSAMDAHAYDGRARWIVAERTLDLSIYDTPGLDGRSNLTYPPGYPLSLALVYWFGGSQGRIIDLVWWIGLLLVLVDVVARRSDRLTGLAAAFLVAAAPEFWRHASLGLTNLSATAAIGAATLTAMERGTRWRPALLFGVGTLLRIDTVVPALAVALFLAVRRRRADALLVGVPALVVALGWQVALSRWIHSGSAAALRPSWLPDPDLFPRVMTAALDALIRPGLYGWCFGVFVVGLAVAAVRRARPGAEVITLIGLVLVEFVAILALYQQIDPTFGGGGGSYLSNSLKRALFVLMPGAVAAGLLAIRAPGPHDPRP